MLDNNCCDESRRKVDTAKGLGSLEKTERRNIIGTVITRYKCAACGDKLVRSETEGGPAVWKPD
ncbi:hypothetical protein M1B34_28115 [Pseudomonas sp. MAFF 302030]|uniref:Uncharacterized protein n=1 Tax=Pseudomonas morbosilactucae TaxID=2938197 RepID=A0A9X1Z5A2_9PSED|nr:hypothetical protein [Pseudomonas morbosilactucae]MCK9801430.1 hypothetical protein [Pseudomonas morbosilactucae]